MTITVILICFKPPPNFLGGNFSSSFTCCYSWSGDVSSRFNGTAVTSIPARLSAFTVATRDLCFSLVAFARQQNYANINGWLSTNIGGTMGNGPGKNPLNWDTDATLPVQFPAWHTLFVEVIWGIFGCIHVYGYWINPKYKHLSIEHLWNINTHHRTRQNVHQKTMIRILTMFSVKYCYPASPLLLPTMPKDNISFFAGCLTVLICHSIALAACCSALGSLSTMGLSERFLL